MRTVFDTDTTDAILLVDATNAFNNLNRLVALHNIQCLCPSIATALINCYRTCSNLFVGGKVILSREGTTQGDPLAMAMFGLATLPLIQRIKNANTTQCWFADDAAAGACLLCLRLWWDSLTKVGPKFGYFRTALKLIWSPSQAKSTKPKSCSAIRMFTLLVQADDTSVEPWVRKRSSNNF